MLAASGVSAARASGRGVASRSRAIGTARIIMHRMVHMFDARGKAASRATCAVHSIKMQLIITAIFQIRFGIRVLHS